MHPDRRGCMASFWAAASAAITRTAAVQRMVGLVEWERRQMVSSLLASTRRPAALPAAPQMARALIVTTMDIVATAGRGITIMRIRSTGRGCR